MVEGMSVSAIPEEGWDVLVTFRNRRFILYQAPMKNGPVSSTFEFGGVRRGSFDLTVEDAENLAIELLLAAKDARKSK